MQEQLRLVTKAFVRIGTYARYVQTKLASMRALLARSFSRRSRFYEVVDKPLVTNVRYYFIVV